MIIRHLKVQKEVYLEEYMSQLFIQEKKGSIQRVMLTK